ncbi:MAG TPA: discoidin domain-containing protein [Kofleriaceae bacterium]|nr:discoidin domain-containing protein [Kofleriaceae bacterium]
MRVNPAVFIIVSSILVAGCGSEPGQDEATATARQSVTDDPLEGPGRKFIDYGMMMFDWIYKISQIYEPTLSTQDLLDMRGRIGALESNVIDLRNMAKDLARFIDAVAAEDRARDVSEAYAAMKTGLDIAADQPDRAADASDMELLAANTLDQDEFYLFAYLGGSKRFDPRMATPTFIAAVTNWLAARERGSIPMSAPMDDRLLGFVNRLDWIVAQTRASVSCASVQNEIEQPCGSNPDSGCTKFFCEAHTECWDSVIGEWSYFDSRRTTGHCSAVFDVPAPDKERVEEQRRYAADTNEAIAVAWRKYADAPNLDYALNQPAFQWPDIGLASAQNAVDGRTDGQWLDGSVTHTDQATGPWWWVDLGSVRHIREIRLFNRTDCCSSRLSHYQVHVSADSTDGWDGTWAPVVDNSGLEISDGDGSPLVHPVDTWARWVAVTKTDFGFLSLAEVQVMGD